MTPPQVEVKPIALKVIEMSTGEVVECPNIARYEDAFQIAKQMARIPEDWTEIVVACAPPTYGPITPEAYHALQSRKASGLSVIPKQAAHPKSVIVVMTYAHVNNRRKLERTTRELRVENDQSRQDLLEKWVTKVRDEKEEPWSKIARKMSLKEADYQWFTGSDNPLQFPWYDHEAITFKDPQRPSTEPVVEDEPDGPSFGPGANGSPGPKPPGPRGPSPPSGLSGSSGSTTQTDGGPPPFTNSTVVSRGQVGVTFQCQGRAIGLSVRICWRRGVFSTNNDHVRSKRFE
jgi:hypothetical protein